MTEQVKHPEAPPGKVDVRIYIGILFLRWKLIILCFLLCMLAGVLYIQHADKEYETKCSVMVWHDPNLVVANTSDPLGALSMHAKMLQSRELKTKVVNKLKDEWGKDVGSISKMMLPVQVEGVRGLKLVLNITVTSPDPVYGSTFTSNLVVIHKADTELMRSDSINSAAKILDTELARMEGEITKAEDDMINYMRLNQIPYVKAAATMESRYLEALMERYNQLSTELMLMEAQYPVLEGVGPAVVRNVFRLNRATGEVRAKLLTIAVGAAAADDADPGITMTREETIPDVFSDDDATPEELAQERGWHDLRFRLAQLRVQEKELVDKLQPEHPKLKAVKKEITTLQQKLGMASGLEMARLRDRHQALRIELDALEKARYQWQSKNLLASKKQANYRRKQNVVKRVEKMYQTLYSRSNEIKVSEELKSERFRLFGEIVTDDVPVWPDPIKILLVAVVLGLGSGVGLALTAYALDNKVQSITDVESVLGLTFLGGIPFWAHGKLETSVRPIVTEEHSMGAVEAYRALRTSVLAAANKIGENIVVITSADSKEGKTLTALNLAIMTAQAGSKTLLVDMDLRRGRLHRSLAIERAPGVTDALKDGLKLRDVVRQTRHENLWFVPTGETHDNVAELLHASDIKSFFSSASEEYDYIIIDTSPVLRVTDSAIIATQGLGAIVYVAHSNRTPKPLISYSLEVIRDANIIGVVINGIEMHKISSLYYSYIYPNYAYYSNAYAYGYDYGYYYGDGKGPSGGRKPGAWASLSRTVVKWLQHTFLPMD